MDNPINPQGNPLYGKPNQSRVWYNSAQQRWDGLVPKNDEGPSASDHYILKGVDGIQEFTDVELEDRNPARPDVFWDDASGRLYVLGSHRAETRFWRVRYDGPTDTYAIDPNVPGVVVPDIVHADSNRPGALHVSPNRSVWVAVMRNEALEVQHSPDGGVTWMASPITLDSAVRLGVTTWVHFEHAGTTYVGVFAGENGEDGTPTYFYFWYIDQNDDPSVFGNWFNDSPNIPAPQGQENADDHVSAARDAMGNQYFAVKTEGGDPNDPLIKLYRRTPAGDWSPFTVTQTKEEPEQSRPSLVVDDENDEIRVYTTDTGGGDGNRVKASLGSLEDLAGAPFTTLFSASEGPFSDVVTPRHAVDSTTGIVTVAHNRADDTLWFGREEVEPALCESATLIAAKFNRSPIDPDAFIWFSSSFKVEEPVEQALTLNFTASTIEFHADGTDYVLDVPPSVVRIDPSAAVAMTDFSDGQWITTVPAADSRNVFLAGLAFQVPADGLPERIGPVTWSGSFQSDTPGVSLRWKWAAAVYDNFSADHVNLDVVPIDVNGRRRAGTPDPFALPENLLPGARGVGGDSWTGSTTGAALTLLCAEPR
jgi:hypothetical protein